MLIEYRPKRSPNSQVIQSYIVLCKAKPWLIWLRHHTGMIKSIKIIVSSSVFSPSIFSECKL